MTSRVPTAAAGTIRVSMEEPAPRSVNPPVFGTTAPVLHRLLGNTARFSRREAVRITKQPGPPPLDCTQLTMMIIKPSRCSVILIQSLDSLGTWLSPLVYPTNIAFRYLHSLWIFHKYLILDESTFSGEYKIHSYSFCFHNFLVS